MLLWTLITAAWAGCTPVPNTSLVSAIEKAEQAFVAMELDSFSTAHQQAQSDLHCLAAPVSVELAARVHRLEGLAAFVAEDEGAARRSFAVARLIDAEHPLLESIAPEGSVLRTLWDAPAQTDLGLARVVDSSFVDGLSSDTLPTSRPTVLQRYDQRGNPLGGAWLDVGQDVPTWSSAPLKKRTAGPALVASAGVCLAVAGALIGVGLATEDGDTLVGAGAVAGGTALGLGIGGAVAWAF